MRWIHFNGIPDVTCQQYVARDGNCSAIDTCMTCDPTNGCYAVENYPKIKVAEYGRVIGDENIQKEIMNRGPVACYINSKYVLFLFYMLVFSCAFSLDLYYSFFCCAFNLHLSHSLAKLCILSLCFTTAACTATPAVWTCTITPTRPAASATLTSSTTPFSSTVGAPMRMARTTGSAATPGAPTGVSGLYMYIFCMFFVLLLWLFTKDTFRKIRQRFLHFLLYFLTLLPFIFHNQASTDSSAWCAVELIIPLAATGLCLKSLSFKYTHM